MLAHRVAAQRSIETRPAGAGLELGCRIEQGPSATHASEGTGALLTQMWAAERRFGAVRARGMRIAVATTDDRAPTRATLEALGVAPLVDALACGDDGRPIKPAPDAILALCRELGVTPAQTAVVGDTTADMRMGRAAGVGLNIGVLSGVGSAALLAPLADVLLPSIAELLPAIGD